MTKATHRIIQGDCREALAQLPSQSVHCCVTSPPYWGLRDYDAPGQIGLEPTPADYLRQIVDAMSEVWRVLRDDGTLWLNIGDTSAGSGRGGYAGGTTTLQGSTESQEQSRIARGSQKPTELHKRTIEAGAIGRAWTPAPEGIRQKETIGIPWMVAFALREAGWMIRQEIIWHKPNPMPESVTDRCTRAHEYIFLLSKKPRYYFDAFAISERAIGHERVRSDKVGGDKGDVTHHSPGSVFTGSKRRNKRSVWSVSPKPYPEAHFATFPPKLIEPCILAGCPEYVCEKCGAPATRIVESETVFCSGSGMSGNDPIGKHGQKLQGGGKTRDVRRGPTTISQMAGWNGPACDCKANLLPGTVLDPFMGSGTTLAVALSHGRSGIGCEINPAYIEMAERRIRGSKSLWHS